MPTSPYTTKTFHLTALDREMLDPERGGRNDSSWWYRGYFSTIEDVLNRYAYAVLCRPAP